MAARRFVLQNEKFQPLSDVEVEMIDTTTGAIVRTGKSSNSGLVDFPESDGNHAFRPKITRNSGKSGELTTMGSVRIHELPRETKTFKETSKETVIETKRIFR